MGKNSKSSKKVKYDSDLSEVKECDWIWTIQSAWVQITSIDRINEDDIISAGLYDYLDNGKVQYEDSAPSAFIKPPKCFKAGPRPYSTDQLSLKVGDMVLVKDHCSFSWKRAYFKRFLVRDGKVTFFTFNSGSTEFSAIERLEEHWDLCIPFVDSEENYG